MGYAPLIRHLRRSLRQESPAHQASVAKARREFLGKAALWLLVAALCVAYGLIAWHFVIGPGMRERPRCVDGARRDERFDGPARGGDLE